MLQSLPSRASTNNAAALPSSSAMRAKRVDRPASPGDADTEADEEPSQLPNKRQHFHAVPHSSPSDSSSALHLLGLLLQCAEAVATDRLREALDLLPELSALASPFGSSPERVAAYFIDALRARLVGSFLGAYTPIHSTPNALPRPLSLALASRAAKAFQALNSRSPLVKFSHFTANQAIFHAIPAAARVHIIDLDVMQGLQWPGLFHMLASRAEGKPLSVRLTGVGSSLELLDATGRRLADFAAALGLPFRFRPFEGKIGHVTHPAELLGDGAYDDENRHDNDEITVVHWTHHCLYDVTGSDLRTVQLLRAIRPRLITIVEQDLCTGTDSTGGFLGRFIEALHYYSALFDALGDTCTATSDPGSVDATELERHVVERQVLGCEIRNIVAVGGPKRTGEVRVERWGDELQRTGFRRVSLTGSPAAQAGLLLGMYAWKGYTLVEEGGCLKLGWKDLSLLTASAWEPTPELLNGGCDGGVPHMDRGF